MRENRATILSTEETLKTCHIPNFAAHIPRFINKQTKVIVFVHFCFRQFFGLAFKFLLQFREKKHLRNLQLVPDMDTSATGDTGPGFVGIRFCQVRVVLGS